MLSVIQISICSCRDFFCHCGEHRYAECQHAEFGHSGCHYDECLLTEIHIIKKQRSVLMLSDVRLIVVIVSVIMLSVIMFSAIMLSVIMPSVLMLSVVTMIFVKLSVNNLSGISSEYHYSECHYFVPWVCAVCSTAECRYTVCHYFVLLA
jgi:hypothetical protein